MDSYYYYQYYFWSFKTPIWVISDFKTTKHNKARPKISNTLIEACIMLTLSLKK